MIVACKIWNGLSINGFALKPAVVAPDRLAAGRERIAGFEITRGVPDHLWEAWYADNRDGPIVRNGLVHGVADTGFDELAGWCWQHIGVSGNQRAGQG